jgi:hypothetical protein
MKNWTNAILIFVILIVSFEFLSIMSFVISKQLWQSNSEIIDYKIFFLEIIILGKLAYAFSKGKK